MGKELTYTKMFTISVKICIFSSDITLLRHGIHMLELFHIILMVVTTSFSAGYLSFRLNLELVFEAL